MLGTYDQRFVMKKIHIGFFTVAIFPFVLRTYLNRKVKKIKPQWTTALEIRSDAAEPRKSR